MGSQHRNLHQSLLTVDCEQHDLFCFAGPWGENEFAMPKAGKSRERIWKNKVEWIRKVGICETEFLATTTATTFSKLLITWQPDLVWWYVIISQSSLWKKKWITAFRVKMLIFVHMISSNHQTFCFQIWYCGASLWVEVSCKKFDMLFSRSRSQQELIWSKNDNFYCIFWTVDPFVFKVKVTAKCCNLSESLNVVQMIFSDWLNLLRPNLVWWCIIMSQIVFQKDWFAVFKVKVTVMDNIIKIWLLNLWSELLILLQLNLVARYIIFQWIVLWKGWIALLWSRSRSQKRFRILVNVHLDDISSAAEPSVTKLGMMMQHHGSMCHARRMVCCLQVQDHSEGSTDQI